MTALLLLLLLATAPAAAQDLSRADPGLRFLLMNRGLLDAPAARSDVPVRPDAVAPTLPGLFEPYLDRTAGPVLVRTLVRIGPGGEAALVRRGAILGTRAGDIVTARVPLEAIPELLSHPSVRSMAAAPALRPQAVLPAGPRLANDSANSDANFGQLRRRAGETWEGLAGQGVIIGVYDGGLDLEHADFRRPDGSTRVLFAWDQSEPGPGPGAVGPHTFDYGTECSSLEIDEAECPMTDRVGHGTHVTGVAAGDGSATGMGRRAWRFPGGAPGSDLIIVKGADVEFTGDRLVDGIGYIFARAQALGRPAVVNVSLSSQSGPHDGTTLLEEALDALSGPGRIIVSGAGNAGDHRNTVPPLINGPNHAEARAGGVVQGVRIPAYRPTPGAANDGLLLELWYGAGDSIAITVRTPDGQPLTAATGDSASLQTADGTIAILNAVDGPDPGNGDHGALIAIADAVADAPPDTGVWSIEVAPVGALREGGDYHLWLLGSVLDADEVPRLVGSTTNRYLVGVPASADRIIAAGAHVTRHEWDGVGGERQSFPAQEALGDIAYFSSPGPRRDGVSKPDVTAGGKVVISARAADASLWDAFPWLVEADSAHAGLLGTSMSSPRVAAAVAILLQLEPELTPEQARDALRLSAATDAFVPSSLPDPAWGAGKLDAAAAAERVRPDGLVGDGPAVALSSNPVRSDALVISYREPPKSVAVYTVIAERVRSFGAGEIGPLTTVWPLDTDEGGDVANGVYVLVVELAGERIIRKIFVARP